MEKIDKISSQNISFDEKYNSLELLLNCIIKHEGMEEYFTNWVNNALVEYNNLNTFDSDEIIHEIIDWQLLNTSLIDVIKKVKKPLSNKNQHLSRVRVYYNNNIENCKALLEAKTDINNKYLDILNNEDSGFVDHLINNQKVKRLVLNPKMILLLKHKGVTHVEFIKKENRLKRKNKYSTAIMTKMGSFDDDFELGDISLENFEFWLNSKTELNSLILKISNENTYEIFKTFRKRKIRFYTTFSNVKVGRFILQD